jgi:lactoylglutathione lyase
LFGPVREHAYIEWVIDDVRYTFEDGDEARRQMIPVEDLFESHLAVADLNRSMTFFADVLGFELAHATADGKAAFFWIGGRENAMLGLWESQGPQKMSLHVAFRVKLDDLLVAAAHLRAAGIEPRDFSGNPTDEPVVLAWMPAASLYFYDPDGNLLEFLAMLPEPPEPALHVVSWTAWMKRRR